MYFQVFFVVATADLYMNGRGSSFVKQIGIVSSLAAVAINETNYYILSICLWFIGTLIDLVLHEDFTSFTPIEEPKSSIDHGETKPKVGQAVLDLLKDGEAKFEQNIDPVNNCEGKPWVKKIDQDGIKIYCSDYIGKSIKRWKIEVEVFGTTQKIYEQLFDYDKRLGKDGWDTALAAGRECADFGDGLALTTYTTAPQGGGLISSREVVDIRKIEFLEAGGFRLVNVSVNPKMKDEVPGYPAPNKKLTRAISYPGCGCMLTPLQAGKGADDEQRFKYTLLSSLDLKGFLPTSAVNSALPTALLDSHKAMLVRLESVCGSQKIAHGHSD